jgi:hypothetical protein
MQQNSLINARIKIDYVATIYKSMTKPKKRAYSGRGGSREGSGRPTKWNNTPSIAVRVPEALKNQILAYAKELDKGTVQNQTGTNGELLKLIKRWQDKAKDTRNWIECNKLLIELQTIITPPNND